jgi:hypothetical protein
MPKLQTAAHITKKSMKKSPKKLQRKGSVAGAVRTLKAKAENRRANRASMATAQKLANAKKVVQTTKDTTPKYKTVIAKAKQDVKKPEIQSKLKAIKSAMSMKKMGMESGGKVGGTSKSKVDWKKILKK